MTAVANPEMKRHLRFKFFIIVAVILVCLYGIIGIPRSKAELVDNWQKNIHLGLDLRGGTYLVVQVQQQDAFNAQAATDADRLKEVARRSRMSPIPRSTVDEAKACRSAMKAAIVVKGVPATQAGTLRGLVNDNSAMDSDPSQRDRLPADHAPVGRDEILARRFGPDQEHTRSQDQCPWSERGDRAAAAGRCAIPNCWFSCRAWMIRRV